MINVKKEGIVFSKSNLGFESSGVLNPAIIQYGDSIHMFYRAVAKGNYSTIGYAKFKTPLVVAQRFDCPIIFPQFEYEIHGVEDPRIVKIDDVFYMSYCGFDGVNALGALVTSLDLITWEKQGVIVPQLTFEEFNHLTEIKNKLNEKYLRYNEHERIRERKGKKVLVWDKNVVFFPRRIDGKLYFLHRIKPDIQIVAVKELTELTVDFWQNYLLHFQEHILLEPKHSHEVSYIGAGCPPIETTSGWLVIYHSVTDSLNGYVYSASAALLDLKDPHKVIARLPYPLFKPEFDWELVGEVNNVCFPSGAVVIKDILYIYYGAADAQIACASLSLSELLEELKLNTTQDV